jgi:hypothetical protein
MGSVAISDMPEAPPSQPTTTRFAERRDESNLEQRRRERGAKAVDEFFRGMFDEEELAAAETAVARDLRFAVDAGEISPLAARRMQAGLTQAALAARAGLKQPQISRWEKPEEFEGISLRNIRLLAQCLGVSAADLLEVK